ncbi:MAG: Methyltransferase domain-containing protein [Candidatus Kentron sp. G]|nr:MAG: Methyltransferase domain-containing protein [Candidatus Kentron sp. G]VFN05766.1 MAG: Methyltransferase domain-containing protein [Candidatus Kentron sp. G]VFN06605.1 MAG: Methyltransferase domain-containing protein [Candidatus Kentron sp. G]
MNNLPSNVDELKKYYGTILQGSADLKTSACCSTGENLTPDIKAALANINNSVLSHFYGCGSPLPPLLEGCTVLDLGCGSGRDVYLASQLVGPGGRVIGVDMTEEQLKIARKNRTWHMARFGYVRPNVDFHHGYMENLGSLGIRDNSVDVVISNCVLNLSLSKRSVFGEIFRVLKPGGELFFSDVFAGRRVPERLLTDPMLHGECLAGALYLEDFRRLLWDLDCPDYRIMDSRPIALDNPKVEQLIGMVDFYSVTVRAFKLTGLEYPCEDYGQMATYHGTISGWPHFFDLDDAHRFIAGKPTLVCGNTAAMLAETRYRDHFVVQGGRSVHFGPSECNCVPSIESLIDGRTVRNPANGGSEAGGGCRATE